MRVVRKEGRPQTTNECVRDDSGRDETTGSISVHPGQRVYGRGPSGDKLGRQKNVRALGYELRSIAVREVRGERARGPYQTVKDEQDVWEGTPTDSNGFEEGMNSRGIAFQHDGVSGARRVYSAANGMKDTGVSVLSEQHNLTDTSCTIPVSPG